MFLPILALLVIQATTAPPPLTDQDAYAVYAAVLRSERRAKELVLEDTTSGDAMMGDCLPKGPDLKGAWAEALADYTRQNATPRTLTESFPPDLPHKLITKAAIERFFKGRGIGGWDDFHAAHPDSSGFVQVSAVGFDTERTHAILFVAHFCGGLCGGGGYYFLVREAGAWQSAHPNIGGCTWVS